MEGDMLKSERRCGTKHISKSKVSKADGFGALLDAQLSFCVAGGRRKRIAHLVKSQQNVMVLEHFQKRWQAWDI